MDYYVDCHWVISCEAQWLSGLHVYLTLPRIGYTFLSLPCLYGLCILFSWFRGFTPDALVSTPNPKTCTVCISELFIECVCVIVPCHGLAHCPVCPTPCAQSLLGYGWVQIIHGWMDDIAKNLTIIIYYDIFML